MVQRQGVTSHNFQMLQESQKTEYLTMHDKTFDKLGISVK